LKKAKVLACRASPFAIPAPAKEARPASRKPNAGTRFWQPGFAPHRRRYSPLALFCNSRSFNFDRLGLCLLNVF
jgi:hypothetical protein